MFDEGCYPAYEYQEFHHLLSCVNQMAVTLLLVTALMISAYSTTTDTGQIMKFDDLLDKF